MKFLLIPLGTYGDVRPFLEIGAALVGRGHQVVMASAEPFREAALERGMSFEPIVSRWEHEACLAHPDLWHRRRFFQTFVRGWILPSLGRLAALSDQLTAPQEWTLVAAYSGAAGARLLQELSGARYLSMWADPASMRSLTAPPMVSGLEWLPILPYWLRRGLRWWTDRWADHLILPTLNGLRAARRLPPVHGVLDWMISPTRSLCLFPDWYAARQPDWPRDCGQVAFPLSPPSGLGQEVHQFLAEGPAPVLITFGTGMRQPRAELEGALRACLDQGQRALLIAPAGSEVPSVLPSGCALFQNHPSFASLLPRCQAIIHHGGMGTSSQALAAGIPQLVVPLAHDQPDNAWRLNRLGAGLTLKRSQLLTGAAGQALGQLLQPSRRQICQHLSQRLSEQDGVLAACRILEEEKTIPQSTRL